MYIKHLSAENIYFTSSYKDQLGNLIINSWEDITNSQEEIPTYFYKKVDNSYLPITVQTNKIEETYSLDEIKETNYVIAKKIFKINGQNFDPFLDINNLYFYSVKNKQVFLFKQDNKFYKMGKNLNLLTETKDFTLENEIYFIQDKKDLIPLNQVISEQSLFSISDEKYFIQEMDVDNFDLDDNDMIGFDSLNNCYIISGDKYKILINKKFKAIKEKDILSNLFYEHDNSILALKEFNIENALVVKKLTLKDLEDLLWNVADIIRDETSLDDVMDYMRVSIPLLTIKRLLDIREEYLKNEVLIDSNLTFLTNKNSYPDSYLKQTFKDIQKNKPIFSVMEDKIKWYGVTWEDVISFIEQDKQEEREIKLKNHDLTIKTNATTRQTFLKEIIDNFYQTDDEPSKLKRIFKVTDFINKITDNKKISKDVFEKLLKVLSEYSFNYKNANEDIFSNAYMYLISEFAAGAGKKGGEFFTPTELIRKLLPFLEIELPANGNIIIGDPTSGSCSFVLEAGDIIRQQLIRDNPQLNSTEIEDVINQRVQFITQEKGETTEVLGELNLMFKGFTNHISYNANSILDYSKTIGKHKNTFRYVVGNPPYGLKNYGMSFAEKSGEERWSFGIPKDKEGEYAFIETFVDMLDPNGKAGIVLPLGTLFKDSTRAIRKQLIEQDLIEGLIVLPGAMFQTTQIPVVFWIINKNKKEADKGKIFMVNASQEFIKKGKFNEWQNEKSFINYINRSEEDGLSKYVDFKDIEKKNWNLSITRYVFTDKLEDTIQLEDIVTNMEILDQSIENHNKEFNVFYDIIKDLKKGSNEIIS